MTGSNKSGEDHAAGTLASPSPLLFYKSLSAQASSIFHEEWSIVFLLYWMRPSSNRSMYFMLPTSTCILLKINLLAFYALWGCFTFFCWFWYSWQRRSSRVPTSRFQCECFLLLIFSYQIIFNNKSFLSWTAPLINITVHSRRERTVTVLDSILPINIWDRNSSMAWFWHI